MESLKNVIRELDNRHPIETFDVIWAVERWIAKGNPFFMDYVVVVCDTAGITMGPALLKEVIAAAAQRYSGVQKGTLDNLKKELDTFDQLAEMAVIIAKGADRLDAAIDVVSKLELTEEKEEKRISTLDQYYRARIINTGIEDDIRAWLEEGS
jgi:hypothetical protein